MTILDKRETAAEAQFVRNEEQAFLRHARLNKLLGLWAAEQMGMNDHQASNYALILMTEAFYTTSLIDKIYSDFQAAGVALSKEQILAERARLQKEVL